MGPGSKLYGRVAFERAFSGSSAAQAADAEPERRFDTDGNAYTWEEFREFYSDSSDSDGVAYAHWNAAKHWAHKLTKALAAARSIPELLELYEDNAQGVNHVHIPTVWHKLGKLSKGGDGRRQLKRNEGRLHPLREHTVAMLPQLREQGLANMALGLANAGLVRAPWDELWNGIGVEARGRLGDFNSQGLANTVWAFATAKHASPELFGAVAEAARGRLGEFNSQELANTVWAFATAKHAAPELLLAIEAEGKKRNLPPNEQRGLDKWLGEWRSLVSSE